MPPAARPRLAPAPERDAEDPLAHAILAHARAMTAVADGLHASALATRQATLQREGFDAFFAGLSDQLDGLRHWLKRWTLPILISIPGVLTAIGAITPNAAEQLAHVLKALGHS